MNKKKPLILNLKNIEIGGNDAPSKLEVNSVIDIVNVEDLIEDNTENPEDFASSDRYKKLTGRSKQLNLKVTKEFRDEIKDEAISRKKMIVEVVEEAWETYKQLKQKK